MVERRSDEGIHHESVNVAGHEGYRLTGEGAVFKIGEEVAKGKKLGIPTFQVAYRRCVDVDSEILTKFRPDGVVIYIHREFGSSIGIGFYQNHRDYREKDVVKLSGLMHKHENGLMSEIVVVPSFSGKRKDYLPDSRIAEDFAKFEAAYLVSSKQ